MSLTDWQANGWLIEQQPDAREVRFLLAIADRELGDSRVEGLSVEARFNHAYSAALQSAAAALAACGYRAERSGYHYRVIDSLRLTVGLDVRQVERLDRARRKRNLSDYERPDVVSLQEAEEMVKLARDVRRQVQDWLATNHPDFLSG
ncbi:MAG: hypothetical protein R6X12_02475 [bacterium]